jgi:signal peptidase II
MKTNIKLFFVFLALIVLDQLIKNFSSFYICNKNIAWSIPIAPAIFYFAWTVIIGFLVYLFSQTKTNIQKIFIILIFSGAISNIFDRIRLGCVIDYIDLNFWPVFNLADAYITIGVIFFIIFNFQFSIFKK